MMVLLGALGLVAVVTVASLGIAWGLVALINRH